MKNELTLFIFLAALVTCLSAVPAAALITTLDVLDTDIVVGESFDIVVSVEDETNLLGDMTAFGFDVDPAASLSLLSFDSATVDIDFLDVSSGGNNVAGVYMGAFGEGNDVNLAALTFTALMTGTDTLLVEGIVGPPLFDKGLYYELDMLGQDIIASVDITVASEPTTIVPEPATMLLLGTGLLGAAAFRKKFKK